MSDEEAGISDAQKQLVEQISAISIASADLTCRLVFRLVNLKKLSPGEALLILGDLSGHTRDLAIRNKHIEGSELVYHHIADRIDAHSDQLQRETGATVQVNRRPKP
ncbi:hypothetical protein OCK02_19445 [Rhizobium sp. TRM96647]|uniref:hypothetical protein n=1 Tax=unclassified Rhizobium TaxID=2613769 RepID=UPI0021E920AD|nr:MULTISPECIES: hypothetical protein [unclassified Rhizobium]MCV3738385.1 hypothetical protein [Rhizobium sp. TRM96647]MCV3759866.1 hypothetical protein [Rhizobium sp. TRM96650]